MGGPVSVQVNPRHDLAEVEVPLARRRRRRASFAALATLRERLLPATLGRVPGASYAVTGETAGHAALHRRHQEPLAARVRVRARPGLPAAAVHVPLARDPGHGDRAEPAVGRRRLRRARVDLPGRATCRGCSGSTPTARSSPGCRCSCSRCCSASRWTTTCSSSAASRSWPTAARSTSEAVARGIRATAGTVTAAAAVMVAVFAIFATLSTLDIKQMGVGLAVAVLIDATIIRGVLLPATMKLLGRWNWYLPRWLRLAPAGSRRARAGPRRCRRSDDAAAASVSRCPPPARRGGEDQSRCRVRCPVSILERRGPCPASARSRSTRSPPPG